MHYPQIVIETEQHEHKGDDGATDHGRAVYVDGVQWPVISVETSDSNDRFGTIVTLKVRGHVERKALGAPPTPEAAKVKDAAAQSAPPSLQVVPAPPEAQYRPGRLGGSLQAV